MVGIVVNVLFFGVWIVWFFTPIVITFVVIHLWRKTKKEMKKHPERYKNLPKSNDGYCPPPINWYDLD